MMTHHIVMSDILPAHHGLRHCAATIDDDAISRQLSRRMAAPPPSGPEDAPPPPRGGEARYATKLVADLAFAIAAPHVLCDAAQRVAGLALWPDSVAAAVAAESAGWLAALDDDPAPLLSFLTAMPRTRVAAAAALSTSTVRLRRLGVGKAPPTPENLHLARCCALGRHVALGFYFAALLEARRRRACARARWWEALPERSPLQPLLATGICIHLYMPFDLTENFRVRKKSMVKSRVPLDRSRSDR